jgi:subtilisin
MATLAYADIFAADADLIGAVTPEEEARREIIVFDADPQDVAAHASHLPEGVLLEPEIPHFPMAALQPGFVSSAKPVAAAQTVGSGDVFEVTVTGAGAPLAEAVVYLWLRSGSTNAPALVGSTDAAGTVRFAHGPGWQPVRVIVVPRASFWPMEESAPTSGMTVDSPGIPEGGLGWWHKVLGLTEPEARGEGVTVGVIDTGCGPHPHLAGVQSAGAFVDGSYEPGAALAADVDVHGTHVCGTIAARPTGGAGMMGLAPAAAVVCARVFRSGSEYANQGDIAAAIEHLATDRAADLINLSLGAPDPSQIELDAIRDALDEGALCICAAGNSAGGVLYPAAFPETVAVSALGLEDAFPEGSVSASRRPTAADRSGAEGLYLANFSCFGTAVDCTAPGVGIVSTVPENCGVPRPYAAMDGTSMASPAATGVLAGALSGSASYLGTPRGATRPARAREELAGILSDVGLDPAYQGGGMPRPPAGGA